MLSSRPVSLLTSLSHTASRNAISRTPALFTSIRYFTASTATMGKDSNKPTTPPKHEMVYFPGLTSEVRSFGKFRKVEYTGLYSQLVTMEIPVGGDIGNEVHVKEQTLIFTSGEGKAIVAGKEQNVKASDVVIVPAGTEHQFLNTSKDKPLELVTIYSPAEHDPQTVHETKEEGDEEEESGKDEAPAWSLKSTAYNEEHGFVKESGGPHENGDDGRHEKS